MLTKKKFKNRHLILKVLQENFDKEYRPDSIDSSEIELSFQEIVKRTKLSGTEIRKEMNYIQKENEICINEINFNPYYFITQTGTVSYFDNKYLTTGKKEFLENVFDTVKIISTIILLTIAIVSFIINILNTKRNKEEIETLKEKIDSLEKNLITNDTLSTTGNNAYSQLRRSK